MTFGYQASLTGPSAWLLPGPTRLVARGWELVKVSV
jgi:hypothetical protein